MTKNNNKKFAIYELFVGVIKEQYPKKLYPNQIYKTLYDKYKEEIIPELLENYNISNIDRQSRGYIEGRIKDRVSTLQEEFAEKNHYDRRIKYCSRFDKYQYQPEIIISDVKNKGFGDSKADNIIDIFEQQIKAFMEKGIFKEIDQIKITRHFVEPEDMMEPDPEGLEYWIGEFIKGDKKITIEGVKGK